ncbi:LytR family transcriptional regulator [Heyndrickxia vini]|uniref:Polyisoprenyl-teichoic acid--peptidoglycan teichoic acid transferase TagU n=1 Tax=Heyndrickxia vini TaxID=1476025 RepID=A0ABX7E2Q4_9BACI|nr:LytR family transcriptional regulator [Heyndrickxia vini]QQZ09998.1 LytR family transcriptional regulator [Heyndrickxia vini]
MRNEKKKTKKKKRWLTVLLIIVGVFVLGGGAYAYSVWHSFNSAVKTIHTPVERKQPVKRHEEVTVKNGDPFSVLLLGVDERKNDKGRSDTMIVMTVNPHTKSIKMLSIPRDTRTELVGHGTVDKINHAYAYGDVEMSMDTVEQFLNIPIDYYVKVNMEGFEDVVDAVGGVKVHNDLAFSAGGVDFPVGDLTLNGSKALKFSRMRHDDPEGDFGRQKRQREIIEAILDEGASISSLWNYDNIFDALAKNVKTNFTFDEMLGIQSKYKDIRNNIEEYKIKGENEWIPNAAGDNIYYYAVTNEERQKISDQLRKHLELGQETVSAGQ